jgi:hypothetical protein
MKTKYEGLADVLPRTAALVVIALIAFALGWLANGATFRENPVHLTDAFEGKVSQVDALGSAFCVVPDAGGEQRCSYPLRRPGAPKLELGQHVGVSVGWVALPNGVREEVFIVYSPAP